jgi:hypothetical protein
MLLSRNGKAVRRVLELKRSQLPVYINIIKSATSGTIVEHVYFLKAYF